MSESKKGSEQVLEALEKFIIRVATTGTGDDEEIKVLPEVAKVYFEAIKY
ncbi:MAG: hypothetical protein N4A48_03955 [Tepidibacter sp.]|nr:hypothetical protein [Tepidibacter sp.]MCT4507903.1 hypothetical protein [Tepidibacter sp.]MCT4606878.1 hypothetical protein [Marinisporobacter sp.]